MRKKHFPILAGMLVALFFTNCNLGTGELEKGETPTDSEISQPSRAIHNTNSRTYPVYIGPDAEWDYWDDEHTEFNVVLYSEIEELVDFIILPDSSEILRREDLNENFVPYTNNGPQYYYYIYDKYNNKTISSEPLGYQIPSYDIAYLFYTLPSEYSSQDPFGPEITEGVMPFNKISFSYSGESYLDDKDSHHWVSFSPDIRDANVHGYYPISNERNERYKQLGQGLFWHFDTSHIRIDSYYALPFLSLTNSMYFSGRWLKNNNFREECHPGDTMRIYRDVYRAYHEPGTDIDPINRDLTTYNVPGTSFPEQTDYQRIYDILFMGDVRIEMKQIYGGEVWSTASNSQPENYSLSCPIDEAVVYNTDRIAGQLIIKDRETHEIITIFDVDPKGSGIPLNSLPDCSNMQLGREYIVTFVKDASAGDRTSGEGGMFYTPTELSDVVNQSNIRMDIKDQ